MENMLELIVIVAIGLAVISAMFMAISRKTDSKKQSPVMESELNLKNAYQKKWMFSYNEKEAYYALKKITDKHGYILFAKVRLLDLMEPQKDNPKYKTFFYKIQAKHVDFVLCDQKLVAKFIIELDDNSHNRQDRKKRDAFVDTILKNVGYKILHIRAIQPAEIEKFLHTP